MILVKESHLPTCTWLISRTLKTVLSPHGNVIVVDVHTSNGNIRRPISKVSLLPIIDNIIQSSVI